MAEGGPPVVHRTTSNSTCVNALLPPDHARVPLHEFAAHVLRAACARTRAGSSGRAGAWDVRPVARRARDAFDDHVSRSITRSGRTVKLTSTFLRSGIAMRCVVSRAPSSPRTILSAPRRAPRPSTSAISFDTHHRHRLESCSQLASCCAQPIFRSAQLPLRATLNATVNATLVPVLLAFLSVLSLAGCLQEWLSLLGPAHFARRRAKLPCLARSHFVSLVQRFFLSLVRVPAHALLAPVALAANACPSCCSARCSGNDQVHRAQGSSRMKPGSRLGPTPL